MISAAATAERPLRIVVGVSGATGTRLAARTLELLRSCGAEIHLVMTGAARRTAELEWDRPADDLLAMADTVYDAGDIGASIASGSFEADGMVVVPCSMKTVAGIASGYSDNLLLRAADVCMKEGRPLVLAAREMPLSGIHLRNLQTLAAIPSVSVCPPVLSYYHGAMTLEGVETQVCCRLLRQLGLRPTPLVSWEG